MVWAGRAAGVKPGGSFFSQRFLAFHARHASNAPHRVYVWFLASWEGEAPAEPAGQPQFVDEKPQWLVFSVASDLPGSAGASPSQFA